MISCLRSPSSDSMSTNRRLADYPSCQSVYDRTLQHDQVNGRHMRYAPTDQRGTLHLRLRIAPLHGVHQAILSSVVFARRCLSSKPRVPFTVKQLYRPSLGVIGGLLGSSLSRSLRSNELYVHIRTTTHGTRSGAISLTFHTVIGEALSRGGWPTLRGFQTVDGTR